MVKSLWQVHLTFFEENAAMTVVTNLIFSFFSDLLSRIDLDELMKKDEPPFTFPKTLEEFEYAFNECECSFESSNHKPQVPQWIPWFAK